MGKGPYIVKKPDSFPPVRTVRSLPSNTQLLADAKLLLGSELERIAALSADADLSHESKAAIVKQATATIDAVLKAAKAMQAIKEVEADTSPLDRLSDAELLNRILVAQAVAAPPTSPLGPGSVESKDVSEPGTIFQNLESTAPGESHE